MAEDFKVIETQEQLNEIIKGRLEREQKKHSEAAAELQSKYDTQSQEFEALKSANEELLTKIKAYDEKYANTDNTIEELQKKIKAYEDDAVKSRICIETGLALELKDRLKGETEEDYKKDAEELLKLMPKKDAPMKSTDTPAGEDYYDKKYGNNPYYKK